MAWSEHQKYYVEPQEVARELTSKENHIDDDWEHRDTTIEVNYE